MPGLKAPSAPLVDSDKRRIDALTAEFFGLFSPTPGTTVSLQRIHDLFIPQGIIVRTCGPNTEVFSISEFIAPRELLLNDGSMVDLCEHEEWETTEIFGNVAQRFLVYRKTGVLRGERFNNRGMMTIQFVRMEGAWKMSAIAWDDERDGLVISNRHESIGANR
ncbi:MAG TPA: DUF4440 domain-containing protein [Candidatus Angelobacter sp.]|nr:DUF4440 domain-containing protein [Candidatus Angelobacter sp.]